MKQKIAFFLYLTFPSHHLLCFTNSYRNSMEFFSLPPLGLFIYTEQLFPAIFISQIYQLNQIQRTFMLHEQIYNTCSYCLFSKYLFTKIYVRFILIPTLFFIHSYIYINGITYFMHLIHSCLSEILCSCFCVCLFVCMSTYCC